MKNLKKQKGITIIALSVTLVILLILTGITLHFSLGENGLIRSAQNAKELAEIDDETSTIKRATLASLVRSKANEISKDELDRSLEGEFGSKSNYSLDEDENLYIINVTKSKRSYLVDKNGNISQRGKWGADYTTGRISINGEEAKSGNVYLEIGDTIAGYDPTDGATINEVISYGESTEAHPSANGYADTVFRLQPGDGEDEQTVSYNLNQGWKLLGVTSSGNLIITTAEVIGPVSGGFVYNNELEYELFGRTGYKYGLDELDNISKLYGQGKMAINSRSIKMEDLNKITKYNPEDTDGNGKKYKAGTVKEYGAKITYYWNNNGTPYYTCSNSNEITDTLYYGHNPFYYWDGTDWQGVYYSNNGPSKIVELTNTAFDDDGAYGNGLGTKKKNLIKLSKDYFIASRYFYADQKYACFSFGVVNKYGQIQPRAVAYSHTNLATQGKLQMYVRPVIVLDNNINIAYENGVWTVSAE